jgi:polyvinyl alcohol dehydrogenase (cytochrome)
VALALALTMLSICLTLGTAQAAAGCAKPDKGGEWRSFGHDLSNTRAQPGEHTIAAAAAADLESHWAVSVASIGGEGGLQSTPIVADGCVFAGSTSGTVFALNADTGKLVWKTTTGKGPFLGGIFAPTVQGGRVYLNVNGTGGPFAEALDEQTGRLLWHTPILYKGDGKRTNASTVIYDGLMLSEWSGADGSLKGDGGFAVIDADTGRILKKTFVVPPKLQKQGMGGGGLWSTAAVDPATGYAYAGSGNPGGVKQHRYTNSVLKIDLNRGSETFGEIVDAFSGQPDQYFAQLRVLEQLPTCGPMPQTLEHAECGQIDMDFGAAPNLFRNARGDLMVGTLQKSGVYHAIYADTMQGAWSSTVAATCHLCNADATAYDGKRIYVAGSPGSALFALNKNDGSYAWAAPIVDGTHYEAITVANGVVYTTDTKGNLDTFDAETGLPLFSRPMSADTGGDVCTSLSGGVSVARNSVYATCDTGVSGGGWIIAYGFDSGI